MFHAWREGMKEWKRVYEIEELKKVIMEGKTELSLDDYVKKLAKKEDQEEEVGSSLPKEEPDNDLYYFSKEEKAYKIFDPRTKTWSA